MSDKVQSSIAVAVIKVNGTSIPEAERDLQEIVVDSTYNLPSMATIRFLDPKFEWIEGTKFKVGAALTIALAPSQSMGAVPLGEVFAGEIAAIEPDFSALGTTTLTIRAYDKSHRLHLGTKTRTFLKQSDADIIRKIAQGAGLQVGDTSGAPAIRHEYVVQPNITDFEFLSLRAKRAGAILSIVGGKLNFSKPDKVPTGPPLVMGETLRQLSVRMSATRQSSKFEVRGWDYRKKDSIVSTYVPKSLWAKNGDGKTGANAAGVFGNSSPVLLTSLAPALMDEAKALVQAAANDQEGQFTEADGVAYGHPKLVAGVKVKLDKLGTKFTGDYIVTSATHIYNSAGYETHFTIAGRYPQTFNELLNGNQGKEPGAIYGMVIGIVTNNNDPESLGRVKVKFPWWSDTEESNWARIVAPSAGKGRGIYFVPEVNDEVLVAFEHGNPNYPYIMGGLWNGKDAPPEKVSEVVAGSGSKVVHRVIYSRTGHQIIFDDTEGDEAILIADKTQKNYIYFDSPRNTITVKSEGNIIIDAKRNLDITVGGNMTVKVTGKLSVSSMGAEIKSTAEMKLESSTMTEMKSAGPVRVQSTGGLAEVAGNAVKVAGNLAVTVTGNPIMLN
jgi:uncharacterized protein involved in type VI secretion and phage assembly